MRFSGYEGMLYSENQALLSARQNFVLQFDARLVKADGKTYMQVRFQHERFPGNDGGQFMVSLDSSRPEWRYNKLWPGRDGEQVQLGPAVPLGATTQVTVLAGGSRFAILLNGKPAFYRDDPEFVYSGEIDRLFSCEAITAGNTVCEYDNVKFWKLGE